MNLENAVTERGVSQPNKYTFRVGAVAFDVAALAAVDVVTGANNHAAVATARGSLRVWMAPKP